MAHELRTLRDLVPPVVVVLTPAVTLRQAFGLLDGARVPAAPVLSRGVPIGIVSAAAIEARLGGVGDRVDANNVGRHTVEDVMTRRIIVLPPHADQETAKETMRQLAVDHVIVMDGNGCLGLLSSATLSGDRAPDSEVRPG